MDFIRVSLKVALARYFAVCIWPGIALSVYCCAFAARAQQLEIFRAQVAVVDRSPASQAQAYRLALSEVLTKLSGRMDLVTELPSLEQHAGSLMQQFRFVETPRSDDAPQGLMMEVHFNPTGVRQLAAGMGLPIWPLERGLVIAWVAVDAASERDLLDPDGAAAHALLRQAQRRGVPMLLPLMDLEDRGKVSFADIWGGFADHVLAASVRYDAQFALLARVYAEGPRWAARWQLSDGQRQQRWRSFGASLSEVMTVGVDGLADALARRFASLPRGESLLYLRVYGVESIADYGRIQAYLQSLSVVEAAYPVVVLPDNVEYVLRTHVGSEAVARTLDLGRVLTVHALGAAQANSPGLLQYDLSSAVSDARPPP